VHILHVTEASAGGTLQVVRTLAAGQAARGHAVTLAYAQRPESPADLPRLAEAGVEPVSLPWVRRSPRSNLATGRALRRLARERQPDVVHLHSSFAGVVGAAVRGVPAVYTPHGYAAARVGEPAWRALAYAAVDAAVARRVAVVAAVSDAEAELARTRLRAPRVAVLANGIPELDPGALPTPGPRPEPLVVAVGRLDDARRPDAAARILGAVADVAAVRWIGGGSAAAVAALRAAGVEVTGWLPRERALAELAKATACLHWSAWDGNPLAVLEALAHDVVVVASDIPANRELLGAAQVRGDEAAAAALLRTAVGDTRVREELLERQRERRGRWSAERMVADSLALYERVARGRPPVADPRADRPTVAA
jgi:glycosyltransferase involved in cell wall biosynthesis